MPSSDDRLSRLKVALRQYVLSRLQAEAKQREVEEKSEEVQARYASLVRELQATSEVLGKATPAELEQLCVDLRDELERIRTEQEESWGTSSLDQVLASTFQSVLPASFFLIEDCAAPEAAHTDSTAFSASLGEVVAGRSPGSPDPTTCRKCGSRAAFHITEVGSGELIELHYCEEHAREYLTDDTGM